MRYNMISTDNRKRKILDVMATYAERVKVNVVARDLGWPISRTSTIMKMLVDDGKLRRCRSIEQAVRYEYWLVQPTLTLGAPVRETEPA